MPTINCCILNRMQLLKIFNAQTEDCVWSEQLTRLSPGHVGLADVGAGCTNAFGNVDEVVDD